MEATIGMSTASAIIFSIDSSKKPMTLADIIAVPILITSHRKRERTVDRMLSDNSSSPTPPSRLMSSPLLRG